MPMTFGTTFSQAEQHVTKAATLLEQSFRVSTWKNFGIASQQTVMEQYQVNYDGTATTTSKWNYVDVNGQPQRYWDLSAFPYEFRAVSPYSTNATITQDGITLNASSTPFQAQTYIDDTYSTVSEPFMVSHVKRVKNDNNYEDTDIIRNSEINNDEKADATRGVHMPFHHLISKIGFRLFINDPQPSAPDYKVFLKSIKISVVNADNSFITASKTYTATNAQGLGKGTFSDNTTRTGEYMLLQHGYYTEEVSGVATEVDFRRHLSKETAYDLCPLYLQQIPQGNIKLRIQLNMETDHLTSGAIDDRNPFDFDVLLSLDKTNTTGDIFTWEPDTRYIYYLHIPNLHGHTIYVNTCEILPWDEVQTADIPIEL